MTATLTAQIIDSVGNRPAGRVRFQLYWVESHGDVLLRAGSTTTDGSAGRPLLEASKMSAGTYKLVLHMGEYFDDTFASTGGRFLDIVPVVFVIDDASRHTFVRVSVSPTSYTVERNVPEQAIQ
jgi:5-hydroxyisourate hydrolase-like protein (transthyretin family)